MKTISYFILACVIGITLTSGLTVKPDRDKIILLRPVAGISTSSGLDKTVKIISARLKAYGLERPEVTVLPGKNQIKVQLPNSIESSDIEGLLTIKGDVAFYATFTKKEVRDLLKSDNQLFRLLNSDPETSLSESKIGCTSNENHDQVNECIESINSNIPCKFYWNLLSFRAGESIRCLYAINPGNTGKPLLNRSDIESAKAEKDKDSNSYKISISLRHSAAGLWADATRNNINHPIAITVDSLVLSAPTVRSAIEKGVCEINGNMTLKEVNYILSLINNESLPLAMEIVK